MTNHKRFSRSTSNGYANKARQTPKIPPQRRRKNFDEVTKTLVKISFSLLFPFIIKSCRFDENFAEILTTSQTGTSRKSHSTQINLSRTEVSELILIFA